MNKKDDFDHPPASSFKVEPKTRRSSKRKRAAARPQQRALSEKGRGLSETDSADPGRKQAERLLAALHEPGAQGRIDPDEDDTLIVSRIKDGFSISAGRFPLAAAKALERRDLASWEPGHAGHRILVIGEAGRAHLRRRRAPDDPFLRQHESIATLCIPGESGSDRVRFNLEESPLDWLRRRKGRDGRPMIDEASYQAGERLRVDITLGGLLPGVTAQWGLPKVDGPSSPGEATDRMIAARQRVRHAFDAVGADFSDLLMDLCGFLKGLELIERERGWPARSAKIVVRIALSRLAEHYGLGASAHGPGASRGVRAWQAVVIDGGRS
jgi:hypothetical protein